VDRVSDFALSRNF